MLTSWIRHKNRRESPRYEDDIVSAVFGPLRYLGHGDRIGVFLAVLNDRFPHDNFAGMDTCSIDFWPNIADGGRIEPDLVVRCSRRDGSGSTMRIIIEAKWSSGLSGDRQLVKQWEAARKDGSRDVHLTWHIFLTREPQDLASLSYDTKHRSRLANLTWSSFSRLASVAAIARVSSNAARTSDEGAGLKRWADDVRQFMDCLGESLFSGFCDIQYTSTMGRKRSAWMFHRKFFWPELPRVLTITRQSKEPWRFGRRLIDIGEAMLLTTAWRSPPMRGPWKYSSTQHRTTGETP
ncbi:MAG: hypothetical protein JSS44_08635 [Proteobacteria bacterium]|nr:hypothetical protein [Pseudomonadota bacterium]